MIYEDQYSDEIYQDNDEDDEQIYEDGDDYVDDFIE